MLMTNENTTSPSSSSVISSTPIARPPRDWPDCLLKNFLFLVKQPTILYYWPRFRHAFIAAIINYSRSRYIKLDFERLFQAQSVCFI